MERYAKESESLIAQIKKASEYGFISKFRLNYKMFNILNLILQRFKPLPDPLWGASDSKIGNINDV